MKAAPKKSVGVGGLGSRVFLSTETAASEIRQACDEAQGGATQSPFFVIVGAGVSHPPVPLARDIIDHCQAVAKRYGRTGSPPDSKILDQYSYWFGKAYPNARQRQQYLRSLMANQALSEACLRLAHLLAERRLTNLVVTTNFDDFLSRALRLFGAEPAVCDHPRTVSRINPNADDIQILHVHGSYLFYDLANLRGEVTGRARADEESSLTIVGLLDSLLWNRSPLVVGYSGWEGDVVMSALRRRVTGGAPMASSIYWFCYKREDADRLPSWLINSPDLRLVGPPEAFPDRADRSSRTRAHGLQGETESTAQETQSAAEVFNHLNLAFELPEPQLFTNPFEHFARYLEASLPGDDSASSSNPYTFREVIERIRLASSIQPESQHNDVRALIRPVLAALRSSRYMDVISASQGIVPDRLLDMTHQQRRELLSAIDIAGRAIIKQSVPKDIAHSLARALIIDDELARFVSAPLDNTVIVLSRHPWSLGYEAVANGKSYGAFTWRFTEALRSAASDLNGDKRISLFEAAAKAGESLLIEYQQCPTVAGAQWDTALFSTSARTISKSNPPLNALLIGAGTYSLPSVPDLAGPPNDVSRWEQTLGAAKSALFRRGQIRSLLGKQATASAIRSALESAAKKGPKADLFLFFFSGRAMLNWTEQESADGGRKQCDLLAADWDGQGSGVLRLVEVVQLVKAVPASARIIVIDA